MTTQKPPKEIKPPTPKQTIATQYNNYLRQLANARGVITHILYNVPHYRNNKIYDLLNEIDKLKEEVKLERDHRIKNVQTAGSRSAQDYIQTVRTRPVITGDSIAYGIGILPPEGKEI